MFININDHPTNRNKKVFYFKDKLKADHFEQQLILENINYEKQVDEEGDQTIYFGVRQSDFDRAKTLNFLTMGKFRKPFIADPFFRYFVIAISILILALAFIGAWMSNP